MSNFNAILRDECGDEFSVELTARNKNCAYDWLRANYPESRVSNVTSPVEDRARRRYFERRAQARYERDTDY